jgi:phosphonate transport system permease protein
LAKLYSEAIENIDKKPVEGVRSVGGGPLQAIRWAVLPQVLPVMLSSVLYTFESNTRSATILGIVGAGGIGFYLSDRVRTMNWEDANFILLLILLTVYLIDRLSGWVRGRLIKG